MKKKKKLKKKKIVPITHVVPYPYPEYVGHSEVYAYKTRKYNY